MSLLQQGSFIVIKYKPHSTQPLLLAAIYTFSILFSTYAILDLSLIFLTLCNCIFIQKLKIKYILYFVLLLIPTLLSIFIMAVVFSKHPTTDYVEFIWNLFHIKIAKSSLDNALFLSTRVFSLSLVSFIWIIHIDFDKNLYYLMQKKWIGATMGYSLLGMVNAFKFMMDEFSRIRSAHKMRFLKRSFSLKQIYPLLVSASRYAHLLGLSMSARGLNANKTFIHEIELLRRIDYIVLGINIVCIVILFVVIHTCH